MAANRKNKSSGMRGIFVILAAVVCVLAGEAHCRTITVRADGSGDYPTIQAAIDDANDGDEIVCADGTYTGNGNRDIDFLGKAVTVRSAEPNDPNVVAATVIECNGSEAEPHRGFRFHSGEGPNSIVAGLTITNGYAPEEITPWGVLSCGGAILLRGSSPTIVNCIISGSSAESYGGAMYCMEDSDPMIANCSIVDNSSERCGGIYCTDRCGVRIINCDISRNISDFYAGAISFVNYCAGTIRDCNISYNSDCGIYCDSSGVTLEDCVVRGNKRYGIRGFRTAFTIMRCTISNNSSWGITVDEKFTPSAPALIEDCLIEGNQGGIWCRCSATIDRCRIRRNFRSDGGGISCSGAPTISNCIIEENLATDDGGGIYCYECDPIVKNCIISNNEAIKSGGGIYCRNRSDAKVVNCVIVNNKAYEYGGGVFSYNRSNPEVSNSIVWGNSAASGSEIGLRLFYGTETEANICYSTVKGGVTGVYVEEGCTLNWGEGMIDSDPHFAFENDYHMTTASPCIDAGTNEPEGGLPDFDMDLNPRVLDGDGDGNAIADIGVYEFDAERPSIALSAEYVEVFTQEGVEPNQNILSIRNCGGGTLVWEIIEDCEWLEGRPTTGSSGGEIADIVLQVNATGLAHGDYICEMHITDDSASNSPRTIPVTLHVNKTLDVPDEYGTIQAAIDGAVDGDTVVVADGTYIGEGNKNIDFRGKAITVKSENGPGKCVIDCEYDGCGVHFQKGERSGSILEGFTITRASTGVSSRTAGILCAGGSMPTIIGCTVTGCRGHGIVCAFYTRISRCTVIGNEDMGIRYSYGLGSISNCTVRENASTGILCVEGRPVIADCTVSGNSVGISCAWSGGVVRGCKITGNRNTDERWPHGGGFQSGTGSNPIVKDTIIAGNYAEGYGGGALCYRDGGTQFVNCIISGNEAVEGGGGIMCLTSKAKVAHCTIVDNVCGQNGGGISCHESNSEVTDSIVWANRAGQGDQIALWYTEDYPYASTLAVQYCDVEGGESAAYLDPNCTFVWNQDNIDLDPCFVEAGYWADACDVNIVVEPNDPNAVWVDGDYHLLPASPCIDAGDPNYVAGPNETDLDGNPRVFGDRIDMGAYEFTILNTVPVACIVGRDRVVEADSNCEAQVVLDGSCSSDADSTAGTNDDINDFDWYEVIDACDPNSDIYIASGEVIECNLGLGEHLIILEVTDKAGAFDTNEVVITVEDVTPPEFSLWVEPNVLWPPNNKMVLVTPSWEVSDNCDDSVEVSLVDITMSAEGDVNDYVEIGGDGSIYLRARKDEGGAARIYTLTYQAEDDSGNVTVDSATVTVPHDQRRHRHRYTERTGERNTEGL